MQNPTTPIDPYSAAFGAVSGLGKAALDDKTNLTQSGSVKTQFDNSGWNVNFGSGSASSSSSALPDFSSMLKNPMVLVAVAVFLYVKFCK
jgi:hypothetical protein